METLSEVLGNATIIQCLFTASAFLFFYKLINKRMDEKFDKIDARLEKLESKVEDIDRRLCRIEGSLTTHGHCLFSNSRSDQKTG